MVLIIFSFDFSQNGYLDGEQNFLNFLNFLRYDQSNSNLATQWIKGISDITLCVYPHLKG